jgi:hypothetical protein
MERRLMPRRAMPGRDPVRELELNWRSVSLESPMMEEGREEDRELCAKSKEMSLERDHRGGMEPERRLVERVREESRGK